MVTTINVSEIRIKTTKPKTKKRTLTGLRFLVWVRLCRISVEILLDFDPVSQCVQIKTGRCVFGDGAQHFAPDKSTFNGFQKREAWSGSQYKSCN